MGAQRQILIFIPTYNESENLAALYKELTVYAPEANLLILDDNSPDGTGEIADRLAEQDPGVHVIHRTGKLGIGSAHTEGIRWAYDHNYEVLVTMDCDFTHSPSSVPEFLSYAPSHHVVIGSRFLRKNSLPGWNLFRRTLTYFGHFMTRAVLRMPLDATGAFRVYRLDRLPRDIFGLIESPGYSFFFESLYILWLNGARVKEVPVSLPARTQGHSKMRVKDAYQSLALLGGLFRRRLERPQTLRYPAPLPAVFTRATAVTAPENRP
jgi:dolichol-phosphate mannosyltransferase